MRKGLLLGAMLLISAPAFAASVDMTTTLTNPLHPGGTFPDPNQAVATASGQDDCSKCGPLTLGVAIATAMCAPAAVGTPALSAIKKAQDCATGTALIGNKAAALDAGQVKAIEDHLGVWSPNVISRIVALIDPNTLK